MDWLAQNNFLSHTSLPTAPNTMQPDSVLNGRGTVRKMGHFDRLSAERCWSAKPLVKLQIVKQYEQEIVQEQNKIICKILQKISHQSVNNGIQSGGHCYGACC